VHPNQCIVQQLLVEHRLNNHTKHLVEYKHVQLLNSKCTQQLESVFYSSRPFTEIKVGETRIAEPTKNC
jgi:hypothetical protein